MPTKKKRIGFIPREEVIKIIDKLSLENNLSNSKIISNLVEEALNHRGLFNKKTGKITHLPTVINNDLSSISIDKDFNDNEKLIINPQLGIHNDPGKTQHLKETSRGAFDLQTYKKFLSFLKFQEMMEEYNN